MSKTKSEWLRVSQQIYRSLLSTLSDSAARSFMLSLTVLRIEETSLASLDDFWLAWQAHKHGPCNLLGSFPQSEKILSEWHAVSSALWKQLFSAWFQTWPFGAALEDQQIALIAHLPELLQSDFERRQKGVFYTPEPLVNYLCREALQRHLLNYFHWPENELKNLLWFDRISPRILHEKQSLLAHLQGLKICDPACGSGTLLLGVLHLLQKLEVLLLDTQAHFSWGQCLYGAELDPWAAALTRWRLWKSGAMATQSGYERLNQQIQSCNPLLLQPEWPGFELNSQPQFDLFIANPPYVGEKGNKALFKTLREGPFGHFYQARGDLAYYFFHLALEWSKPGGVSAFLTTNYFLTASQAQVLRADLQTRSVIHKLSDFHEWRLFAGAQGQHNLVTLFQKRYDPQAAVQLLLCEQKGTAHIDDLNRVLAVDTQSMKSQILTQKNLYNSDTGHICQPVRLQILDQSLERVLHKLRQLPDKLAQFAQINQGLVSGADRLTPAHIQKYALTLSAGAGIFVLTQKEKNLLALNEREKAYLYPWYKNSHISPWLSHDSTSQSVIYADRLVQLEPQDRLFQHLLTFKSILSQRREVRQGCFPWWQIHWPRQAAIFNGPKLVLPQRHACPIAAWNNTAWYASADVYFITAPKSPSDLFWLLAWINSPLVWLWLNCEGKRKGKLLELYQRPLAQLPVVVPAQLEIWKELAASLIVGQVPTAKLKTKIWQVFFNQLNLTTEEQELLLRRWQSESNQ
jgi:adenine-specific DNA-methyltransferase